MVISSDNMYTNSHKHVATHYTPRSSLVMVTLKRYMTSAVPDMISDRVIVDIELAVGKPNRPKQERFQSLISY